MAEELDGKTNGMGITWPHHKRIAVMLTFDFDAEWLRSARAESKGASIGFTDFSRGQYGPHEGIFRCLSLLEQYGVKGTFFVPGKVVERYQEQVALIHEKGHELGYHGYAHEWKRNIPMEEEVSYMEKSERLLESVTGKKPIGHRAPASILHPFSYRLMAERGYLYSSSMKDCDYAYLKHGENRKNPIVEIPNDITLDDFTFFYFTFDRPQVRAVYTNREVFSIWRDEFDGLAEEGDKVFCLKLHPQLIGRGSRIAMLGELIGYMQQHGAWIATCEEVARYVLAANGYGQGDKEYGTLA